MPSGYAGLSDSTNAPVINWRKFFSDPVLVSLIDTALHNNPDVLMTLQKIQAAQANVQASRGALFPEISAGISGGLRRFGLYTMDGAGNITTDITPGQLVPINLPDYYVGLQTTWEIDAWGKLRNARRAALARYMASIEARNLVVTELIAEVATTYYELVSLDNELLIIRESLQLQEDALRIVRAQKEAGAANELGVSQIEAQVLNAKALELETLFRITVGENRMNFLLGRFPQAVPRTSGLFSAGIPEVLKAGVPSALLANRPDLREAEYELMASKADVRAARAAFFPSLTITGAMGFQAFDPSFLFMTPQSIAYTALGNLAAPLINRSAIKAQFKTANANQLEAYYNYQKAILNGYVEVYNELAAVNTLQQIQSLKSLQVAALERSIESSLELFRAGNATYLEVLLAQQNSLQARLELVTTQQQQFNASANLYKALGGGWQ